MSSNGQNEARKIRARLKYPIIDADGHWAEYAPLMREEFRRIGGDAAVEALAMASARIPNSLSMSVTERRRRRIGQEAFWFLPTKNTLDRATAMMPRLLYERLDDLGLDFSVIYPTAGLGYYRLPPDKLRRALCRAYNTFVAQEFVRVVGHHLFHEGVAALGVASQGRMVRADDPSHAAAPQPVPHPLQR